MGAHNFDQIVRSKKPIRDKRSWTEHVYQELVDDALWEYGHDAYNGTISTTSGWQIREKDRKMTKKQALKFADSDLDHAEKWGDTFVVFFYNRLSNKYPNGAIFYGWAAS